jgi:acyl carrier protein
MRPPLNEVLVFVESVRRKYTPVIAFAPTNGLTRPATPKMPATQSPAEAELAELIISAVNLEGVNAADVDPEAPLFGAGLGLDSIDALELALEISKRYGFQLRSDDEENRRIFASLRSLSDYIQKNRTT